MNLLTRVVAVLVICHVMIVPNVAHAVDSDEVYQLGSNLISLWHDSKKKGDSWAYYSNGHFTGYVLGVVDTSPEILALIPRGTKIETLIQIVGTYLDRHPESGSYTARSVVKAALQDAYSR